NVPPFGPNETATIEMVVWDNSSELYPTWDQASAAWKAGMIAAAKFGPFNIVGSNPLGPPPLLIGLESFNLYYVPEPSAFGVACLAAALALWQWRKQRS